jgi:hypothetical protein
MNSSIINVAETFGLTEDQTLAGPSPLTRRQYTPGVHRRSRRPPTCGSGSSTVTSVPPCRSGGAVHLGPVRLRHRRRARPGAARAVLVDHPEWQGFATRTLVRNFKPKKMIDLLGGRTSLDRVPELTGYPGAQSDSREYAIQVAKYGRQFGFSWEAMINDDLDQLMQIPNTFGQAAALTETENALSVIANLTTGAANTAFFKDYSAVTGYVGSGLNTTPVAVS